MFENFLFSLLIALAIWDVSEIECDNPRLSSWIKSTGYGSGNYSSVRANVMKIYYTSSKVYINANSIPSYSIGPWPTNPNKASAQNLVTSFPTTPAAASTKTATGLGANGFFTNGVAFFNAWDGMYYNKIWQNNAYFVEGSSFDSCYGHPQQTGLYHNHINPICLYGSTDSSKHSPIIGWAFDGYPIYGPYGYSSANNSASSIKRILPSYSLRSYSGNKRTSFPNGSTLSASSYGPDVSTNYPLGYFIQDYKYVSGSGDLDQYNGRWCVTPDFPSGTYAYFIATDSTGKPAYPYTIGPSYYGVVSSTSTSQTIPSTANKYFSI